jgi:hypothetical protein
VTKALLAAAYRWVDELSAMIGEYEEEIGATNRELRDMNQELQELYARGGEPPQLDERAGSGARSRRTLGARRHRKAR